MTIVPSEGPQKKPRLVIVGEAPGVEEERIGRPFVGPSGHLLNQMLAAAGISRADCYITNVSNIRPPGNDFYKMFYDDPFGKSPNSKLCDMRERLWSELRNVQADVVVTMGAEALKALAMTGEIKKYRGTMIENYGIRILPTYHPAFVLRMYENRPIVEADLRKAHRQAINPSKPKTFFNTNPSFTTVLDFLRERPRRLALDIETVNNTTRCIGLAWSKHDAISIPIFSNNFHHWTVDQESEILHGLNQLFLCRDVEFVLQNGPYDLTILARDFGFQIANYALDTMFSHHLLYPELPKGLDFLSSIYTDHPMYWGYNSSNEESTRTYNCMDCVVTFQVADEIEKELKRRGLEGFYKTVIHRAIPAMTRVQSRGMLVDEEARNRVSTSTEKQLTELQADINKALGYDFNPSSPKQVKELVYDKWKLPPQYKPGKSREERIPTSDEDALKALVKKTDPGRAAIVEKIITYRQKRVLLGTFAEMPLLGGRAHTSYNLAGTVTGRISSSRTFDGYGGNLTNIPRGTFRRVFCADPGKVLVKADLSQAEYRVLIWKARIERVIKRLLDPKFSIHMWNAAENIYRIPYDQVTRKMYDEAKNGTYAANYGVGALKVSRMYDMSYQQACFIIQRYHEAVPEIQQVYQAEIRHEINTQRKITNPLGRERLFFGRLDDELYRAAYSHYCQSTVADVINSALIDLDNEGVEILLQVHDELVCQFPEDEVLQGVTKIRRAMERPLVFDGVSVPLVIPVEIKVGHNWYDVFPVSEYLTRRELRSASDPENEVVYDIEGC